MKPLNKEQTAHICIDMQLMFALDTAWHTPWILKILPQVLALTEASPAQTFFTRFIPPDRADQAQGMWKPYFERWNCMTLQKMSREMINILPELARFAPPAEIIDKYVYGPWLDTDLHSRLQKRGIKTLIVSGGEIDICVLATVIGAVDLGYKVILPRDGLCSSDDQAYDATMTLFMNRFGLQIECEKTQDILTQWA